MPSAVRTLQPSALKTDDADATQRRVVTVERRENLATPMPAATSTAPSAPRAPDRSESDRPTLPPRPKAVAKEREEPLTTPVTVETRTSGISPQAARTLGVAIVLAAVIVSVSQIYIARLSSSPAEVTPTRYALRPTTESRDPAPVAPSAPPRAEPTPTPRPEVAPSTPAQPTAAPRPEVAPSTPSQPPAPLVASHLDASVPSIDAAVARPAVNLPMLPPLAERARVRTELEAAVTRCVAGQSVGPLVQFAALYGGRNGRAFRVDINGRANQEPMGACIESATMRLKFTPFATQVWRVEYGVPIAGR